jgi:hypothetical protein
MRFTLRAESGVGFASWLAQVRAQGGVLDDASLTQLVRPTRGGGELTYGSLPEDPFESIVHAHLATHWSVAEAL